VSHGGHTLRVGSWFFVRGSSFNEFASLMSFDNCRATIQLKIASGGPAGGQTFETFDKQVYKNEPWKRSL